MHERLIKILASAFLVAVAVIAWWYIAPGSALPEPGAASPEMLESLTASNASPAPLSASELESLSAP